MTEGPHNSQDDAAAREAEMQARRLEAICEDDGPLSLTDKANLKVAASMLLAFARPTEQQAKLGRALANEFKQLGSHIPEARVSLIARAVRESLRSYGHKSADSTLPECIASDVETALRTQDEQQADAIPEGIPHRKEVNTILARHFARFMPDIIKRIEVGNQACTEVLAYFAKAPTAESAGPDREAVAALIEWARSEQAFPVGNPHGEGRGHIDEEHRFRLRDMVTAIDAPLSPQDREVGDQKNPS
jgi:hypothetical protein